MDATKTYPETWIAIVGKFSELIGKPIDEVTECLKVIVGEPGDEALEYLANSTATPDADIKEALKSLLIPSAKMNTHLPKLRGEKKVADETTDDEKNAINFLNILPDMPDESSFMEMLKTDGKLKVGDLEVMSAIRASLANHVGLYDVPSLLQKKMDSYADAQDEPCGADYFAVLKVIAEKKYSEVLSVINVSGTFVTEARKKALLIKIDEKLWDALRGFHVQLSAWQEAWQKTSANPAMMMMVMTGGAHSVPAGMMNPPDTAPIRSAAETVNNVINKIFSGPGVPVARAMAYEVGKILEMVNNSKIPPQAGYLTKEQMIKDLGISADSEMEMLEKGIKQYALSIITLPKVKPNTIAMYLSAMFQLGSSIPWDKLSSNSSRGIGPKTRNLT
jgi:hypothetical protein